MLHQKIPRVNFLGFDLPKIVLGHDSFLGFTSLYPHPHNKYRIYEKRFSDVNNIVDLVSVAVREGIDAISFGIKEPQKVIEAEERVGKKLGLRLIPIIYQVPLKLEGKPLPITRIDATLLKYRRVKHQSLYIEYVLTRAFKKIEKANPLNRREQASLILDEDKLGNWLKWFNRKHCIKTVMTMVELFALANRLDLLERVVKVLDKLGFTVCAGSHTASVFEILKKEKLYFPAYYAPFNKIGFFMFPSQKQMVKALLKIREPLIAIKPLAGGRIPPKEAFEYMYGLRKDIICMVGLSSIPEIKETVSAFQYVNSKNNIKKNF